jgi:hypothetical protein
VALNVFDTFDSRPPDPTAETNDVGTGSRSDGHTETPVIIFRDGLGTEI